MNLTPLVASDGPAVLTLIAACEATYTDWLRGWTVPEVPNAWPARLLDEDHWTRGVFEGDWRPAAPAASRRAADPAADLASPPAAAGPADTRPAAGPATAPPAAVPACPRAAAGPASPPPAAGPASPPPAAAPSHPADPASSGPGRPPLAGLVSFHPADDAPAWAHVGLVHVHPSRWRRGIARFMLAAAEDEMRTRGFSVARLWTPLGSPAERFYAAIGWTRSPRNRRWSNWLGLELVGYEKPLA